MNAVRKDSHPMGKAQKTMMVPEDLYKLIDFKERTTGTTFTRQTVAALLAYFFTEPDGPDPLWMEAVIAVENGEISIDDVPTWYARRRIDHAREQAERVRAAMRKDPAKRSLQLNLDFWEGAEMGRWMQLSQKWHEIRESTESTVHGLIAHWKEGRRVLVVIDPTEEMRLRIPDPKAPENT